MEIKNILIVDDDFSQRNVLQKSLMKFGFNVISAVDGLDCLRQVRKKRKDIDLIVLDCIMPRLDGISTLRKLKQNKLTRSIPVIMVSADDINAQGCRFLPKPFLIKDILKIIEDLKNTSVL